MRKETSPHTLPLTPHVARKRFGQHFLHDPYVLERIVRAINPQPGDCAVEIGPGLGALTRPLLEKLNRLQVIEIDRDVVPHLQVACGHHPGLTIHQADALTVDYRALAPPGQKLRLAGNLPYNISTPLLFHLLEYAEAIRDMHFMLQKEVVDRMCAEPGTEAYGRLTVTLAVRAEVIPLFKVGPGAFKPPPKVDSAVVRLRPRPPPFVINNLAHFDRVVQQAFGQRRKTLANALRALLPAAEIEAAGVDPRIRAEQLAPADFARISARLT